MPHPLDNPIWNSLNSRHASRAIGTGLARRYPSDTAPFAAIASTSADAERDLRDLVAVGEKVGMVGVIPSLPPHWELEKYFDCVQMTWDRPPLAPESDPYIALLDQDDLPSMLELTALVYPAYFRRGTSELGPYYGIKREGRLCAMAGVRMAINGFQEISAVCTHPESRGKGYAMRLMRHLIRNIQSAGETPFLHTESDNEAALALYERIGLSRRALLPFKVIVRRS